VPRAHPCRGSRARGAARSPCGSCLGVRPQEGRDDPCGASKHSGKGPSPRTGHLLSILPVLRRSMERRAMSPQLIAIVSAGDDARPRKCRFADSAWRETYPPEIAPTASRMGSSVVVALHARKQKRHAVRRCRGMSPETTTGDRSRRKLYGISSLCRDGGI
jgi:hypothetical protein